MTSDIFQAGTRDRHTLHTSFRPETKIITWRLQRCKRELNKFVRHVRGSGRVPKAPVTGCAPCKSLRGLRSGSGSPVRARAAVVRRERWGLRPPPGGRRQKFPDSPVKTTLPAPLRIEVGDDRLTSHAGLEILQRHLRSVRSTGDSEPPSPVRPRPVTTRRSRWSGCSFPCCGSEHGASSTSAFSPGIRWCFGLPAWWQPVNETVSGFETTLSVKPGGIHPYQPLRVDRCRRKAPLAGQGCHSEASARSGDQIMLPTPP